MIERHRSIYLDSNVFIYFVEGEDALFHRSQALFRAFQSGPEIFVTSELTLAEILAPSSGRTPVTERKKSDYLSLLNDASMINLIPVTRQILLDTVELRKQVRLKLPDAIHASTAFSAGCRFFVSHDRAMRQLPPQIEWLDVNEHMLARLKAALG